MNLKSPFFYPIAFWALMLTLFEMFAVYQSSFSALVFVVTFFVTYLFGLCLPNLIGVAKGEPETLTDRFFVISKYVIILGSVLYVVGIYQLIVKYSNLSSDILTIPHQVSAYRYKNSADYSQPFLYTIGNYLSFSSVVLIAIFAAYKRLSLSLLLITVVPIVLNVFIKTQRGSIIFGVILYLVTYHMFSQNSSTLKFMIRGIKHLIYFLLFFSFSYVFLQSIREGNEAHLSKDSLDNLQSAIFGSWAAFGNWFDTASPEKYLFPNTLIEFTFNRVAFYGFGIEPRQPGLFGETAYLLGDNPRHSTTVFTVFRALIEDIGLILTYCFGFLMGVFSGYFYLKRRSPIFCFNLIVIYQFFILGWLASMFNWNSMIFTYGLVSILLYCCSKKLPQLTRQ